MRKFIIIVILLGIIDGISAQKSVFEEINTILSEQKPIEEVVVEVDTAVVIDSTDQVPKEEEINTVQEINEADTVLFQERLVEVKKPIVPKDLKSEEAWSKESQIINYNTYSKKHVLDTNFRVFGWHPYWCGNAYKSYNFSLLSMISYFSYEVNPKNGFYKTIHNWRETPLVDSARKHNCKVLLTITNFGKQNNKTFLRSDHAKKNLISTAITLIRERKADGLTIDFENVDSADKRYLINFLIDLGIKLKSENENFLLTIALPAVDFGNIYDFSLINNYVDYYVVMGYEYHGANSQIAGPVSPLSGGEKWKAFTVEKSVDEYLANGIPPSKLIMGVPYYGAEWITQDLKFPSVAKSFVKYHTYRQAKRIVGDRLGEIDHSSNSKFHTYSDMSMNYRQLWYDDSLTLASKYDWIKEKKIRGVGIWALGFDNGSDELWKLLANKFAYTDKEYRKMQKWQFKTSIRRLLFFGRRFAKNPMSVIKRPRTLVKVFGALTGVSMVVLLVMFRYGRKFKRISRLLLKGGVAAIILFAIALLLIFMKFFEFKESLFLIGGFLLGGILFLIFTRKYTSEKELP